MNHINAILIINWVGELIYILETRMKACNVSLYCIFNYNNVSTQGRVRCCS